MLWATRPSISRSIPYRDDRIFSPPKRPTPTLGPSCFLFNWYQVLFTLEVKRTGRGAKCSPAHTTQFNNEWLYLHYSVSLNDVDRDNCTFTFTIVHSSRRCGRILNPLPPQYQSNYRLSQSVQAVNSATYGNTTPSPN